MRPVPKTARSGSVVSRLAFRKEQLQRALGVCGGVGPYLFSFVESNCFQEQCLLGDVFTIECASQSMQESIIVSTWGRDGGLVSLSGFTAGYIQRGRTAGTRTSQCLLHARLPRGRG